MVFTPLDFLSFPSVYSAFSGNRRSSTVDTSYEIIHIISFPLGFGKTIEKRGKSENRVLMKNFLWNNCWKRSRFTCKIIAHDLVIRNIRPFRAIFETNHWKFAYNYPYMTKTFVFIFLKLQNLCFQNNNNNIIFTWHVDLYRRFSEHILSWIITSSGCLFWVYIFLSLKNDPI